MTNPEEYAADGIEQVDAPVPRWWRNAVLTLVSIAPFYMLYYHIGAPGRSMADQYERASYEASRKKFAEIGELQADEPTILTFMEKENWLKVGKVVFKSNCANCHGRNGEGQVGPNLTDEKYKHIRNVEDIAKVIIKGANNNAMPAWEDKLLQNEIVLAAAYVASLRGTNFAGGKAAEGADIPPWPAAPSPDTDTASN